MMSSGLVPACVVAVLDELLIHPRVGGRDEVHVGPHRIEFGLALRVEDQLVERLVVAEVAEDAVVAGVEVAAAVLGRSK